MITRAWTGPELEGYDLNEFTLFIEGLYLTASEVINIIQQVTQPSCNRIYLGAGGKGILDIDGVEVLLNYCQKNNIKVVCEVLLDQLDKCNINILKNCDVTLTACGQASNYINYFKTDNGSDVYVHRLINGVHTNLSTLTDGLYDKDTLIYSKGE